MKDLTTNRDKANKNGKGESTTLTAVEKMLEKYKETNITIKERNRLLKDMLKLLNLEEIKGESREETEKRINQRLKERQALILKEARIEAMKQELVKAHQEEMEARDKVQKRAGGDKSQGNIKDLNKEWKAKNQHRLNLEKKYGAEVEMDMLERVKREEAAIMDSRFKTISELNNKLSNVTINQKAYNTEVNQANKNAAIDLSGLDADYFS